jgi:hypothetical protein
MTNSPQRSSRPAAPTSLLTLPGLCDIPDDEVAAKMLDAYYAAAVPSPKRLPRLALLAVLWIARECAEHGESLLSHSEIERRASTNRKTLSLSIKALLERGIILRTGTQANGAPIYKIDWNVVENGLKWWRDLDAGYAARMGRAA